MAVTRTTGTDIGEKKEKAQGLDFAVFSRVWRDWQLIWLKSLLPKQSRPEPWRLSWVPYWALVRTIIMTSSRQATGSATAAIKKTSRFFRKPFNFVMAQPYSLAGQVSRPLPPAGRWGPGAVDCPCGLTDNTGKALKKGPFSATLKSRRRPAAFFRALWRVRAGRAHCNRGLSSLS